MQMKVGGRQLQWSTDMHKTKQIQDSNRQQQNSAAAMKAGSYQQR